MDRQLSTSAALAPSQGPHGHPDAVATQRSGAIRLWVILGAALAAALAGWAEVQAQQASQPAAGVAAGALAAPPAEPVPAAAPNLIRQAAEQRGFATCGARVEQVTNFVGFGPAAGAFLMVPGNPGSAASAEQRLLPLVMEIPLGPTSAIVTASFAQNAAGGACSATYDAIVYWPQGCDLVAATQFGSLRRLGLLKRDVVVLDGGPATKVFLMMAGAGCISVKKERVL